jgi:hypothetical protein
MMLEEPFLLPGLKLNFPVLMHSRILTFLAVSRSVTVFVSIVCNYGVLEGAGS